MLHAAASHVRSQGRGTQWRHCGLLQVFSSSAALSDFCAKFHTLLQKLKGILRAQKCLANCLSTLFTSLFCRQSHNRAETTNSRFLKPVPCQSFVHITRRDENCTKNKDLAAVSGHGCGKTTLLAELRTGSNCFDALLSHVCVDPKKLKAGRQVLVCQ